MTVASACAVALIAGLGRLAAPESEPAEDVTEDVIEHGAEAKPGRATQTTRASGEETSGTEETEVSASDRADAAPSSSTEAARKSSYDRSRRFGDVTRRVVVGAPQPEPTERDRASSVVSREELIERLPRSSPAALRFEPGVYIQQTSHGQASPYLRGLTGQQTVMFFDGVRLNNSTFRQGPNQYFFTIDSRTVDHLEVYRGSASTRWGSDAIGGAIIATPIEPYLDSSRKVGVHPTAITRIMTADAEVGGRAQTSVSYNGKLGVLVGAGYRNLGQLRTGGRVIEPETGQPQVVPPVYGPDDKTQLGTGFRELTDDARLVWQLRPNHALTLGYYDYRQFDVPRTDKCPPPTAPQDECVTYLEQFRTLAYGAYEATHGPAAAERVRVTLSYQRQHELRREDRGSPSTTELDGEDDVHTAGTGLKIETKRFELGRWATLGVTYGADLYYDRLGSAEKITFTDVGISVDRPRGQYVDGSQYLTSGTWAQVQTEVAKAVRLRAGGRTAFVAAQSDGEAETESSPVDDRWFAAVGTAGVAVDAVSWLTFVFNADQGFRAPNLDDLTSRQLVGPGFQYENAALDPERSLSLELGMLARNRWVHVDAFVYRTAIRDLIQRASRDLSDCPMGDDACMSSRNRFQLVNLDGTALIYGGEGGVRVFLPWDLQLRTTVSYAWGEGHNPLAGQPFQPDRVPLSRIPPLNGTVEAGWRSRKYGLYLVGAMVWARSQTRLAPQDRVDVRIPRGGTPGYVVFDLRAGYRLRPWILAAMVLENLADAPYRHHGSSTNGPGRGLMVELQFGF